MRYAFVYAGSNPTLSKPFLAFEGLKVPMYFNHEIQAKSSFTQFQYEIDLKF